MPWAPWPTDGKPIPSADSSRTMLSLNTDYSRLHLLFLLPMTKVVGETNTMFFDLTNGVGRQRRRLLFEHPGVSRVPSKLLTDSGTKEPLLTQVG